MSNEHLKLNLLCTFMGGFIVYMALMVTTDLRVPSPVIKSPTLLTPGMIITVREYEENDTLYVYQIR